MLKKAQSLFASGLAATFLTLANAADKPASAAGPTANAPANTDLISAKRNVMRNISDKALQTAVLELIDKTEAFKAAGSKDSRQLAAPEMTMAGAKAYAAYAGLFVSKNGDFTRITPTVTKHFDAALAALDPFKKENSATKAAWMQLTSQDNAIKSPNPLQTVPVPAP